MKESARNRSPVADAASATRKSAGYAGLAAEQALDQAGRRGPLAERGPRIPLLRN